MQLNTVSSLLVPRKQGCAGDILVTRVCPALDVSITDSHHYKYGNSTIIQLRLTCILPRMHHSLFSSSPPSLWSFYNHGGGIPRAVQANDHLERRVCEFADHQQANVRYY